ncbi:EAL domain-containing protein [Neobacillus mesonae]|nr:EAL domain-containing protein [Neobacillus mesonae]
MSKFKWIAGAGLILCILNPWILSSLSEDVSQEFLDLFGLGISLFSIIICFSAFNQGRLLEKGNKTHHRKYISSVFLAAGILELLLFIHYSGITFHNQLLVDSSDVMLIVFMARLLCVLGMLYMGFSPPKLHERPIHKGIISVMTVAYISLVLILLQNNYNLNYIFSVYDPVTEIVNPTHYIIHTSLLLFLLLAFLGLMLSKAKRAKATNQNLMLGILFCVLSQAFILQIHQVSDITFSMSMVFQFLAYFIFQEVYFDVYVTTPLELQSVTSEKLNYMAHYNEVTGLPNRRSLIQHLRDRMSSARQEERNIGLLVLNINRFKTINDSLGYPFGDQLLKTTGERLKQYSATEIDVFSLDGDRYAVVLDDFEEIEILHKQIKGILQQFKEPLVLKDRELYITPSAGISIYPFDGTSPEELLRNANTALHFAKEHGLDLNRYRVSMKREAQEGLQMEHDLRKGLERGEFYLEYQPQIDLQTHEVVGVEALVRWHHPVRGKISPADFIPIAEESGLIVPLGEWVLKEACAQNQKWQQQYQPLSLSVNLSIKQFQDIQLTERIQRVLLDTGLDPRCLELEITESTMLDFDLGIKVLERIKLLGVQISIDDFGTGYSSLHYLKRLPIDRLKIDQSFVRELMEDRSNMAIVSTITSMAKHLQLKVTAEGVENEEQLQFLQEQHCHEGQGYFFSKPLKSEDFESRFLKKGA